MPSVVLKVRRPPSSGTDDATPGGTDYVCGSCGVVIAEGMGPNQHVIVDTAVCSGCGAENEFPPELRA
jgi:DNA-directed RNA polymerase subunit RPC12/RpoP